MTSKILSTPIGSRVAHAHQASGTWAGGTTRMIYAYPPASATVAEARVWVATATIEESAAYSHFPNRLRVHMPFAGNGLRLHLREPDEIVTLDQRSQYRFDGERPVHATLIDGPVEAFNLIIEPDVVAAIQVVRLDAQISLDSIIHVPPAMQTVGNTLIRVVYVLAGSIELEISDYLIVRLHVADAYVFLPKPISDTARTKVELRNLRGEAEIIVATLVFG